MNIDEMPAGPELDKLIAEKITKKSLCKRDHTTLAAFPPEGPAMCANCGLEIEVPAYSTDIVAAWEVWTWLQDYHQWKYGFSDTKADLFIGKLHSGEPAVIVMRDYWDGGMPEVIDRGDSNFAITGDSYQLAICRAALKAVGA